ncbi:MAG: hypothetical protein LKF36_12025 [Lactobacillus sp.]|jgi:glycerophosphoryl diester phosphodiesterase|nr:hypothetical protein [Lactobacillus sp.]
MHKTINWSLICSVLLINTIYRWPLKALYLLSVQPLITQNQFALADFTRPLDLLQRHFWPGLLFYGLSLIWLGLLVGQLALLMISVAYFKAHHTETFSIKQWWANLWAHIHKFGKQFWLAAGLWVLCLPISSFIYGQDYFFSFRLNEVYLYLYQGRLTDRLAALACVLGYLAISYWALGRLGRIMANQSYRSYRGYVFKQTLKMILLYLLVTLLASLGMTLLAAYGSIAMTLSRLLLQVLRIGLGIWWLQRLVIVTPRKRPIKQSGGWLMMPILTIALLGCLSATPSSPALNTGAVTWIAHKGLNGTNGVQNSIAVLHKTARAKPDFVEMDVRMTKDQQFVVMHDHSLRPLTGKKGRVEVYALAQLKQLQISEQGYTAPLSSFTAYSAAAKQIHQKLLVEIKTVPSQNSQLVAQNFNRRYGQRLLRSGGALHSTDPEIVTWFKINQPKLPVGYIVPFTYWGIPKNSADFYSIEGSQFNLGVAEQLQKIHKKVYLWTINDPLALFSALGKAPAGIITDRVSALSSTEKTISVNMGRLSLVWLAISRPNP